MAAKNGKNGIQNFVKTQLTGAQKRLAGIEGEAEKVLKTLVARGKKSRKELEALLEKAPEQLAVTFDPKTLTKRANAAGAELKKTLEGIQVRIVEATGLASQSQLKDLSREVNRLAKKVDALVGKKPKPEARA